ncbi:hypothetical protein DRQ07_02140 [candidate division KSB1 bacterium]|nr:MAG: hypothetical protein DRQ07_02140 [candidate division KSB1 bacterium]
MFFGVAERKIVYLRINEFPVAVERLRDSSLRGRPVAVCSRHSPSAPVLSVSAEAGKCGIYAGMPVPEAVRRCPGLVIIPPDNVLYRKAAGKIAALLGKYSPLVEPGHWGQFFVDLSGTLRIFGAAEDAAYRMRRDIIGSTDLCPAIGVASNKLVSRVAGKIIRFHADMYAVPSGSEASFMAPLKSSVLPAVKKPADRKLLHDLNIRFVHQLVSIPVSRLSAVFGKRAYLIYNQAMGIDNTPVRPLLSKPVVFAGQHIEPDTNDTEILFAFLMSILSSACFKMRSKKVHAKTVWLYVRYCDNMEDFKRLKIRGAVTNEIVLYPVIKKLFTETVTRRQRIKYISLTFTDISSVSCQVDMFETSASLSKKSAAVQAMDTIISRYGKKIEWGHTLFVSQKYSAVQNSYFLSGRDM